MDEGRITELMLRNFGLRVEDEMTRYILRRLKSEQKAFPVIGGDARTGTPVQRLIDAAELNALFAASAT